MQEWIGKIFLKLFVDQLQIFMFYLFGVCILCEEVKVFGYKLCFLIFDLVDCVGIISDVVKIVDKVILWYL